MDIPTLALGMAALLYGIYTAYVRAKSPEKFGKLEAMKRFWGETRGVMVHLVGYTLVPIVVGITLIVMAANGQSVFGE